MYQIVAARRMQWDALPWQVPSLGLAAQAFLLSIALGSSVSRTSRLLAAGLAVVTAFLSLHLFIRQRQAEITDAEWLEKYETKHFGTSAHGLQWRDSRQAVRIPGPLGFLARLTGFPIWQCALALFGLVDLTAFVLAIFGGSHHR
jgi:hypothetical protein